VTNVRWRRRGDSWPEGFRLDEAERHAAHLFCTRCQRHIIAFNINVTRKYVLDEIQKHMESHHSASANEIER
jgi:hypothetical protein